MDELERIKGMIRAEKADDATAIRIYRAMIDAARGWSRPITFVNMASALCDRLEESAAEIDRLRMIVDTLTGPPMSATEVEEAMDGAADVPLDEDTLKRIVANASDPANVAVAVALHRMIVVASDCEGFDSVVAANGRAQLERYLMGERQREK